MPDPICTIESCSKPEVAKRMCAMHYARYRRHGDPQTTYRPSQSGQCTVSQCERVKESKGLCEMHARRLRLNGDPLTVKQGKPASGPANHNWVGDDISYEGWHQRIRNARGSASLHECVDCGMQANDWSYDHSSNDERDSIDGPYALDMEHYAPRCRRCHIIFDAA